MLTTGILTQAGLLVLGFLWLKEMPRRWRSDWHEIRNAPQFMDRVVVGVIWLITLCLVLSILRIVASAALRLFAS